MNRFLACLALITALSLTIAAKDIKLITSGTGATRDEAIKNALMNAIEQTFGSFVSANTTILNDELVKEDIVSIKRGNIKKYSVLYESGQKEKTVTIEAVVKPEKLTAYATSKGSEAELAGQTFGMNLKLHRLHLKNGAQAMEHLYTTLALLSRHMYNYVLEVGEPVLYSGKVLVPLVVECRLNNAGYEFYRILRQTTSAVKNSINSTRPNGEAIDNQYSRDIKKYEALCGVLPDIQRLGFTIIDNLGGKVHTKIALSEVTLVTTNHMLGYTKKFYESRENLLNGVWPNDLLLSSLIPSSETSKPEGKIDYYFQPIGEGVEMESLIDFPGVHEGLGSPLFTHMCRRAKLYFPSDPRFDDFFFHLKNRGRGYLETAEDGTRRVHFVLCYPESKFEKISKISVIPNSQLYR